MEGTPTVVNEGALDLIDLPPGFRFHPTDEEIITHYLTEKVMNNSYSARAIGEVDLNKCEPWDLPNIAKMGKNEWFFFCKRDRKYPTGMRTNRATESGYWKATGKDKEIYKQQLQGTGNCQLVGMKKTLVFYKGRAPKGAKTNWVMHEFRLEGKFSYYNFPKAPTEDWVVCRVFHKNTGLINRSPFTTDPLLRINYYYSFVDDDLLDSPSLPPLMDPSPNYSYNNDRQTGSSSFTINGEEDEFKGMTATDSPSDHGNYLSYFSESPQTQEEEEEEEIEEEEADHKSFLMAPNNYSTYRAAASPKKQMPPNSNFYSQIALPNNNNGTNFLYRVPFSTTLGSIPIPTNLISPAGSACFMIRMDNIEPAAAAKLRAVAAGNYLQGRSDDEVERNQYCKVEHMLSYKSNQSVVSRLSQDTDMTTEISSFSVVVSKQDMDMGMAAGRSNHEDLDVDEEGPSLVGPPLDLDSLWNC